ncbi:MAG: hypothetical protein ACRDSJ_23750 [Rubrobacteraceae bacterium]
MQRPSSAYVVVPEEMLHDKTGVHPVHFESAIFPNGELQDGLDGTSDILGVRPGEENE